MVVQRSDCGSLDIESFREVWRGASTRVDTGSMTSGSDR